MIHHQTIFLDGSVFSEQRLPVHCERPVTPDDARMAGQRYWAFLRRFGRPLLAVHERPSGAIDIALAGLRLLSFDRPEVIPLGSGWALRCPIAGGLAVHPGHAREGYLQITLAPDAVSLTVQGYFPNLVRLHTRIYEWTQSAIHYRVARAFMPELARWLRQEASPP